MIAVFNIQFPSVFCCH